MEHSYLSSNGESAALAPGQSSGEPARPESTVQLRAQTREKSHERLSTARPVSDGSQGGGGSKLLARTLVGGMADDQDKSGSGLLARNPYVPNRVGHSGTVTQNVEASVVTVSSEDGCVGPVQNGGKPRSYAEVVMNSATTRQEVVPNDNLRTSISATRNSRTRNKQGMVSNPTSGHEIVLPTGQTNEGNLVSGRETDRTQSSQPNINPQQVDEREGEPGYSTVNRRKGRGSRWSDNDLNVLLVEKERCLATCKCTWSGFFKNHWVLECQAGRVSKERSEKALSVMYNKCQGRKEIQLVPDQNMVRIETQHRTEEEEAEVAVPQIVNRFRTIGEIDHVIPEEVDEVEMVPESQPINSPPIIPEGAEEGDNGREKVQIEEPSELTDLREHFRKAFRAKVCRKYVEERPLRIPKVRPVVWGYCNTIAMQHLQSKHGYTTLKRVNSILYSVGTAIVEWDKSRRAKRVSQRMEWYQQQRLQEKTLRRYIGWISDELQSRKHARQRTNKQRCNFARICKRYKIRETHQLTRKLESLKEQLKLVKKRIEMRLSDETRKKIRLAPPGTVLRENLGNEGQCSVEQIRTYWAGIIGKGEAFTRTQAMASWENSLKHVEVQKLDSTTAKEYQTWKKVLAKARPNKAPGPDGIPNLLWKKIGCASRWLFEWLVRAKTHCPDVPDWLARGRIVLLPKKASAREPGDFRPIACLNTCYKLITGHMHSWIRAHIEESKLMPVSQRALIRGTWGCTHALLMDRTAVQDALNCRSRGQAKGLACAWLDYAKAFDSVRHSYLEYVLKVLKVHPAIRRLINALMGRWKVRYQMRQNERLVQSCPLSVKCGVLQGDTLSPLLFSLCLSGVSHAVDMSVPKYVSSTLATGGNTERALKVNNIMYVDDMKLLGPNREAVDLAIAIVHEESTAIGLKLNPDKCMIAELGSEDEEGKGILDIPVAGTSTAYKYLGVEQAIEGREDLAWKRVKKIMMQRVNKLMESELSAGQIVRNINIMVNPVARYLFSHVIFGKGWFDQWEYQAKKMDKEIRNLFNSHKMGNRQLSKSRMYISTQNGGWGLKPMIDVMHEAIAYTWCYIQCMESLAPTRAILKTMTRRTRRSIDSDIRNILSRFAPRLNVHARTDNREDDASPESWGVEIMGRIFAQPTQAARKIVSEVQARKERLRMEHWEKRRMSSAVRHAKHIERPLSFLWIMKGCMNKLSWRNAMLVQERALYTNSRSALNGGMCRRCKKKRETVQHIVSGCDKYRTTIMMDRHNSIARALYFELCRKYDIATTHYTQMIAPVVENDKVKLYWDVNVVSRRILKHNRPDIVVFDKEGKRIQIVEISCTWYTILLDMYRVKFHKYATNSMVENVWEELNTDTPHVDLNLMGQIDEAHGKEYKNGVKVVPIVVGVCGEVVPRITKDLKELGFSGRKVPELVERMQRGAVLGTSRLVRAHLHGNPQ